MRLCAVTIGVVVAALAAQAPAPRGLDAEEYHHLLTENELARVWLVEIPGKATAAMHRHDRDYLTISLADNAITTSREDGTQLMTVFPPGEARFVKGGFAHSMRNERDGTYRAISVEIAKSSSEPGTLAAPKSENATEKLEREGFHAVSVSLKPDGELQARKSANPMLLVPVAAVELSDQRSDRLRRISLPAGMVEWLPAGTDHKLKNADNKPARFVVISFP